MATLLDQLTIKQKRIVYSVGALAFVFAVSYIVVEVSKDEKSGIRPEDHDVTVVTGSRMTGVEQFAADMREMRGLIQGLTDEVGRLQAQNTQLQEDIKDAEQKMEGSLTSIDLDQMVDGLDEDGGLEDLDMDELPLAPDVQEPPAPTDRNLLLGPPNPPAGSDRLAGLPPPAQTGAQAPLPSPPEPEAPPPERREPAPAPAPAIRIFGQDGEVTTAQLEVAERAASAATQKEEEVFIPSGSMFTGVFLNGLDAPTSGAAQKNPTPVVMRVKREAVLPNYASIDVRECFLLAAGYGQLASERVMLRTEALSCVRHDGDVIEAKLDAYIVGSDGKVGIPGRLVSKQGAMIAQSLIAGVFGGIGESLTTTNIPSLNITNESGRALTQRQDMGSVFQQGAATGLSTAANQIAEFYLDMAKETFPVVEISAGEVGTVMVTNGTSLPLKGSSRLQKYSENKGKKKSPPPVAQAQPQASSAAAVSDAAANSAQSQSASGAQVPSQASLSPATSRAFSVIGAQPQSEW